MNHNQFLSLICFLYLFSNFLHFFFFFENWEALFWKPLWKTKDRLWKTKETAHAFRCSNCKRAGPRWISISVFCLRLRFWHKQRCESEWNKILRNVKEISKKFDLVLSSAYLSNCNPPLACTLARAKAKNVRFTYILTPCCQEETWP